MDLGLGQEVEGQARQDDLCRLEEEADWGELDSEDSEAEGGAAEERAWARRRRPIFFGTGPSGRLQLHSLQPFADLKALSRSLGAAAFRTLAMATLVGDQILVRTPDRALTIRVIDALSVLLPYGCTHIVYHSLVADADRLGE